jgi:tetratricopeptide (TPR) repeat protein
MYELLIVAGLGLLGLRSFNVHEQEQEQKEKEKKFTQRLGKLWDAVHQGMRENRLLRAEKALLTILKIDKNNAAAYNRLGILYAKQKEYRDAIDCFEIACTIEPTASSLHNLGLIYYETENYEKSVTAFEDALKLEEKMASRHIALAKAYEHTGNENLMLEHLERAAELEPTKETYTPLINAYRKYGMEDKADLLEDKVKKLNKPGIKKKRLRRPKRVVV